RAVRQGGRVVIVQHPGGRPKQVSMAKNEIHFADDEIVQYVTSTEGGSSGAPVFDHATFEVVAMHARGGLLPVPGRHGTDPHNQGPAARAILARLRQLDPVMCDRLTGSTGT